MSNFKLDDYVDVAARITKFYEKFPDGSLQAEIVELNPSLVVVRGYAYRTPEDPKPGVAHSMLGIPGATPYTRGSEIENAETSAIGRAIAFLGFEVKKGIASRQEIANKQHASTPAAVSSSAAAGGSSDGEPWEGKVDAGRPPVDHALRQTPEGHAFGFVLLEETGGRYPKKRQVVAHGDLAVALDTVWKTGAPDVATVWGTVEMVGWQKDGKDMPPFPRIHATRVMTPEWTLPATDAPAPVSVAPSAPRDELEDLAW